jgi:hypothetical protein
MMKSLVVSLALTISTLTWAADDRPARVVDLRAERALADLQRTNPAHFAKIRQVLTALAEQPKLAEGDWLRETIAAQDVDLSRYTLQTSYPPKQLLQFTLDDTRYIMHLARSDLTPRMIPAR